MASGLWIVDCTMLKIAEAELAYTTKRTLPIRLTISPWKLSKEGKNEDLKAVMYNLIEVLRISSALVAPFMPATALNMMGQLGLPEGFLDNPGTIEYGNKIAAKVNKGGPLFPRIEK